MSGPSRAPGEAGQSQPDSLWGGGGQWGGEGSGGAAGLAQAESAQPPPPCRSQSGRQALPPTTAEGGPALQVSSPPPHVSSNTIQWIINWPPHQVRPPTQYYKISLAENNDCQQSTLQWSLLTNILSCQAPPAWAATREEQMEVWCSGFAGWKSQHHCDGGGRSRCSRERRKLEKLVGLLSGGNWYWGSIRSHKVEQSTYIVM